MLGFVEQATADAFDEASREKRPPRAPRPGQDRRLDRPQAPFAEMLEGIAVGVRRDEASVPIALRPVERQRDLIRPLLHSCLPGGAAAGCGGWAGGVGGGCGCGGGGSGGGLFDGELTRTTVPA